MGEINFLNISIVLHNTLSVFARSEIIFLELNNLHEYFFMEGTDHDSVQMYEKVNLFLVLSY